MTAAAALRPAFFPKAESFRVSALEHRRELLPRALKTAPVFEEQSRTTPLLDYDADLFRKSFQARNHESNDNDASAIPSRPSKPAGFEEPYLVPMLTVNERLRLTVLWYYTRGVTEDNELLHRIQDKVELVKDFTGWDNCVAGLIDNDIYESLATVGFPSMKLPRRETVCGHTLQQKPGSVLLMSDMDQDWRVNRSPLIAIGGMRSYAGTQLRFSTEEGEEVAIGTLALASNTPGLTLSRTQQDVLVRFADMIVREIIHQCRSSRRKEQQRMNDLVANASYWSSGRRTESDILDTVKEVYPLAEIQVVDLVDQEVWQTNDVLIPLADLTKGMYENSAHLNALILSHNHERLSTTKVVRAIAGKIWSQSETKFLVVATKDPRLVFDDVDAAFVDRCAAIISSIGQEKLLRQALQVKDDFLRGVTHQLRTPLHGVLGSVDLLAEELAASRLLPDAGATRDAATSGKAIDAAEVLRTIRNSGEELMSTVNNILKLHRWAETSEPDRRTESIVLSELEARIANDMLAVDPEERFSRIRLMIDDKLPADISGIKTDATLLRECLQSLVLNAFQATSSGDVVITISTPEDRTFLQFDVEDTGCGIPTADQERIFWAYEKSDTHTRGVGLGLTLACRMANAMDGVIILVSSTEGKGSHFRATFQNPVFTTYIVESQGQNAKLSTTQSPAPVCVVKSGETSLLLRHLLQSSYLPADLNESSNSRSSVSLVDYTPDVNAFRNALAKAQDSKVGLCLVPDAESVEQLRATFPHILFATGPFTSIRLTETFLRFGKMSEDIYASAPRYGTDLTLQAEATPAVGSTSALPGSQPHLAMAPHSLLVDDNIVNLRILRMFCEKRKFPHVLAMDGLEALDAYKAAANSTEPIRLVLLDLQMPRCDGLRTCTELRAFEKTRGLDPAVIFILTGQDSRNDREQSMNAGANEFFVKPMSFKVLDKNISRYLSS